MGLSRIGPIHHSNVINTVTTTNDLLIMLLDSNFPMTHPLTAMGSVNTITSLVIKLATAGKAAFIIQLPTLLLQSIYRKTISWICNYRTISNISATSRVLYLTDNNSGNRFLIGTGASISVLTLLAIDLPHKEKKEYTMIF